MLLGPVQIQRTKRTLANYFEISRDFRISNTTPLARFQNSLPAFALFADSERAPGTAVRGCCCSVENFQDACDDGEKWL